MSRPANDSHDRDRRPERGWREGVPGFAVLVIAFVVAIIVVALCLILIVKLGG